MAGSLRGGLLLLGTLVCFFYLYFSYAFGIAFNPLFLVYTTLYSASLFALWVLVILLRKITDTAPAPSLSLQAAHA